MNRRPERLSDLLPGVVADLARRHGTQPPTNRSDMTEPGYQRIADAIDDALQSADLRVELKTGTGSDWGRFTDSYDRELYVLARTLDRAGLIDWAAFGPKEAA